MPLQNQCFKVRPSWGELWGHVSLKVVIAWKLELGNGISVVSFHSCSLRVNKDKSKLRSGISHDKFLMEIRMVLREMVLGSLKISCSRLLSTLNGHFLFYPTLNDPLQSVCHIKYLSKRW